MSLVIRISVPIIIIEVTRQLQPGFDVACPHVFTHQGYNSLGHIFAVTHLGVL